jgi:hypothetical protein
VVAGHLWHRARRGRRAFVAAAMGVWRSVSPFTISDHSISKKPANATTGSAIPQTSDPIGARGARNQLSSIRCLKTIWE